MFWGDIVRAPSLLQCSLSKLLFPIYIIYSFSYVQRSQPFHIGQLVYLLWGCSWVFLTRWSRCAWAHLRTQVRAHLRGVPNQHLYRGAGQAGTVLFRRRRCRVHTSSEISPPPWGDRGPVHFPGHDVASGSVVAGRKRGRRGERVKVTSSGSHVS